MIFHTIRAAIQAARDDVRNTRMSFQREAIRAELQEYLSSLPEEQRLKIAAVAVPSQEMTEALLRRFVAACPPDKTIEVEFPGGARVLINTPKGKAGPGW